MTNEELQLELAEALAAINRLQRRLDLAREEFGGAAPVPAEIKADLDRLEQRICAMLPARGRA